MLLVSHMFTTPLGAMLALCSPRGVCLLEFVGQRGVEREQRQVEAALGAAAQAGTSALVERLDAELQAYFNGDLQHFTTPVDWVGTPFQQAVWRTLLKIPYGDTWTYAQEAASMGRPTAVRAVAAANGRNKVSIVVPCHRVIGSDGTLTGYGGGLPRKQWLLELERTRKTPAGVVNHSAASAFSLA